MLHVPDCLYYSSKTTSRQAQVDVSCLLLLVSISCFISILIGESILYPFDLYKYNIIC